MNVIIPVKGKQVKKGFLIFPNVIGPHFFKISLKMNKL